MKYMILLVCLAGVVYAGEPTKPVLKTVTTTIKTLDVATEKFVIDSTRTEMWLTVNGKQSKIADWWKVDSHHMIVDSIWHYNMDVDSVPKPNWDGYLLDSLMIGADTLNTAPFGWLACDTVWPTDSPATVLWSESDDVTKALELAMHYLQPKNEIDDWSIPAALLYVPPAQRLRDEANRLEREAKELEQHDTDAKFIRDVLKRWKEAHP